MEPNAPLFLWPDVLRQLGGFIAAFLAIGAVGFRLAVLRGRLGSGADAAEAAVLRLAAKRAAVLGLLGVVISGTMLAMRLPAMAERHHQTVSAMLATNGAARLQVGLLTLALLGMLLSVMGLGLGWLLAAVGVVGGFLRNAFVGQWSHLVVPVHMLFAGFWIGTLFVMVVAGLGTILASGLRPERRGTLAADVVHSFSPFALTSAGTLAVLGVIAAWQNLHPLSSLWTTPYGVTLIVKLLMVGVVLALGAWNWKRQKPLMGSEAGAHNLRRTASGELLAAGLVLAITAVLVSVPSPEEWLKRGAKPEGAPPGGSMGAVSPDTTGSSSPRTAAPADSGR